MTGIIYWDLIGIISGLYRGYIRIMEKWKLLFRVFGGGGRGLVPRDPKP